MRVSEPVRERESEIQRESEREREGDCVCVCVTERERENDRERWIERGSKHQRYRVYGMWCRVKGVTRCRV